MKKETVFKVVIILGFLALFMRYFSVQVQHGAEYDQMALRNHFRYIAIPAPRGTIWSAEGSTLASNHSSMDVVVYKEEMKSPAKLKARLIQLLSYRKEEILQHWRQMASAPSYIPYPILSDLEESEVPMIEMEKVNFPELSIVKPMRRMYPFAELFSHALGYVAESSPEDLRLEPDLQAGDWIGKTGLERSYERRLKGASGRSPP
jgi:penicillin-binding protein 2